MLAKVFADLHEPSQQREALQDLIESLSFTRIRDFREMVHQLEFRHDIIGNLPIELSQRVLQYLPLYQLFQAHRVSRRWREILCSEHIIKGALGPWYLSRKELSNHNMIGAPEQVDAYLHGRPFSRRIQDTAYDPAFQFSKVVYADGVLGWTGKTAETSLELLHLHTGNRLTLNSLRREALSKIAVSTAMAAATAHLGRCYIWDIASTSPATVRSIQLESAREWKLALSKCTIALFVLDKRQSFHVFDCVTYDLHSSNVIGFSTSFEGNSEVHWNAGLDEEGHSVIVFNHSRSSAHGEFRFTRFDLTGKMMASGTEPSPRLDDYELLSGALFPFNPSESTVFVYMKGNYDCLDDRTLASWDFVRIKYDRAEDCLEIKSFVISGPKLGIQHTSDMFVWRNVVYCRALLDNFQRRSLLKIFDLEASELRKPDGIMDPLMSESWPFFYDERRANDGIGEDYYLRSKLMGDDRFLINVTIYGAIIWCFDKSVHMPNEELDYRQARQDNLRFRVEGARRKEEQIKSQQ